VKQFKYVGPHDEVDIPALGVVVAQGRTVQVPTDLVEGFEGQAVWEHIPDRSRSRAAKKAAAKKTTKAPTPKPESDDKQAPAPDPVGADDDSQEG
jgi:hypothetical protein